MRNYWILFFILAASASSTYALEFEIGSIYRLGVTVEVIKALDESDTQKYTALKNSKFELLGHYDDEGIIVQFTKVYKSKKINMKMQLGFW